MQLMLGDTGRSYLSRVRVLDPLQAGILEPEGQLKFASSD